MNWQESTKGKWGTRAVLFLDPYGLEVDWETIRVVAQTKAIDMWLLFPISGLNRQLAGRYESIENFKSERIDRFLGGQDWRNMYTESDPDLFGETETIKDTDLQKLAAFIKNRLDSEFSKTSEPIYIYRNNTNQLLFLLFFSIGNPSSKAVKAAMRIAGHIRKNFR